MEANGSSEHKPGRGRTLPEANLLLGPENPPRKAVAGQAHHGSRPAPVAASHLGTPHPCPVSRSPPSLSSTVPSRMPTL